MQAFDASSMIYAWDNYPLNQFPGLWNWISIEVQQNRILMSMIAFEEVVGKAPDCGAWLRASQINRLPVGNSEIAEAHRIKTLLNIQNDAYHSKGVGENDLLIIASCKIGRHDLVTDEKRQNNQPLELKKLKIPGVCALPSVSVNCVNFLEFMKRSGAMFG